MMRMRRRAATSAAIAAVVIALAACSGGGGVGDDRRAERTSTSDPVPSESVRVTTWNTLGGIFEGPFGVVADRMVEVGARLRATTDVAGIQEVQQLQADTIARRFVGARRGCTVVVAGGSPAPDPGRCVWALKHDPLLIEPEGHAIISRQPLRDAVAGVLSGDTYNEFQSDRRIYLAATVPGDVVDIRLYATHLSVDCSEREEQATRLLEVVEAERREATQPLRAVILGDLNTEPQGDECGTGSDALLARFADAGFLPPWQLDSCIAYCDLATEEGLDRCTRSSTDGAAILAEPDAYADCGFTYREKATWDRATQLPAVPYRTIDYVLVDPEEGTRFERYASPWYSGRWEPGALTRAQARFERFLAVSDHVPVFATLRVSRWRPGDDA